MKQVDSAREDTATAVKCDLAGEVLRSFGSLRFAATGWSMLPTIWPGDTLVVERRTPDRVRVGEVVLVGREGRLCAHRVISQEHNSGTQKWITQGDAMSGPDRPVAESELLGRVAYLIRAGRLIELPTKLNLGERLTAGIVRRSVPAARALVFLHRMVRVLRKSVAEESVLPCQG
jgi:signal peptidase I